VCGTVDGEMERSMERQGTITFDGTNAFVVIYYTGDKNYDPMTHAKTAKTAKTAITLSRAASIRKGQGAQKTSCEVLPMTPCMMGLFPPLEKEKKREEKPMIL